MNETTKKRILILEDAREDRLRFRYLLEEEGIEPDQFEFAWAWPKSEVAEHGVLEWFCQQMAISCDNLELRQILEKSQETDQPNWLSNYSLIFLDLAWSAKAERVMGEMQLLPPNTGIEMSLGRTEYFEQLCNNVEGVQFLEWWKEISTEVKPNIWVTSAYLPSTAWEIRQFIKCRYQLPMFHKWNDEQPFLLDIRANLGIYSDLLS